MDAKKGWFILNALTTDFPVAGTKKPDLSFVPGTMRGWSFGCFGSDMFIVLVKTEVETFEGKEGESGEPSFVCDFEDPDKESKLGIAGESIGIHGFTGAEVDIP